MKLILAIVQNDDAKQLIKALTEQGFSVTRLTTTGGFLQGGNVTLLIGVAPDRLQAALDIIRERSGLRKEYTVIPSSAELIDMPVQVTLGGATVFVVDVEAHYKF
ncbi:MAG: cyclic-di-AMP receptor [Bacillota bacterium]